MRPIVFTRESLHPVWSDLSERCARARAGFSTGAIDEKNFRARLNLLGFSAGEIEIEVAQNRPTFRHIADITKELVERIRR